MNPSDTILTTTKTRSPGRRLAVLLLALGLAAGIPLSGGQPRVRVRVNVAPPAPIIVVRPAPPSPRYVWVEGYWRWSPRRHKHVWVRGTWRMPPPHHETWVPGHWEQDDDEWEWEEGHWE